MSARGQVERAVPSKIVGIGLRRPKIAEHDG